MAEVDLENMPVAEAAEFIWDQMRAYMKEKGGKRATELFKEIDKDRSGKIDVTEFKIALEKMKIPVAPKKVLKEIMKTADPKGGGDLDYKMLLEVLKEDPKKKAAAAAASSGGMFGMSMPSLPEGLPSMPSMPAGMPSMPNPMGGMGIDMGIKMPSLPGGKTVALII